MPRSEDTMEVNDNVAELPDVWASFCSPAYEPEGRTVSFQRPPPPSSSQYPHRGFVLSPVDPYSDVMQVDPVLEYTVPLFNQFSEHMQGDPRLSASFTRRKASNSIPYTILGVKHLRLVNILPAPANESMIDFTLEECHMDRCPTYTAISYAWGDRRDTAEIYLCNGYLTGESITVTSTLRDALMALRHPTEPVRVWVDALSINQSDNDELCQQVQIMDSIYRNAADVAVWLGPSSDNSSLAIQALRQIGAETNKSGSETDVLAVAETISNTTISAIVDLFERCYWRRLWIVQEVFYAKRVILCCGSDSVEWKEIAPALLLFSRPEWKRAVNRIHPPGKTPGRTSRSHYSFAQVLASQGPQSLLYRQSISHLPSPITVMRHTRDKLAARPQDKVLGVLSLFERNIRSEILPDFNLIPREAFAEVVISIIKVTGSLDIICEAMHYPYHRDVFDLPSWVADWSHAPDISALAAMRFEHRKPFNASGYSTYWDVMQGTGKKEDNRTGLTMCRNEPVLNIIPLGTITSRGMAVGTLGRLTNYLMAFLEWRHLMMDEFGGETHSECQKFCRTLCLGEVPSRVDFESGSRQLEDGEWTGIFYSLFTTFLVSRLGRLPLDPVLEQYSVLYSRFQSELKGSRGRDIVQHYFGDRMMGRCFCVLGNEGTKSSKAMGMGTGFMGIGDLVVVARGCSTPIILRSTSKEGRFEFVGDVYVDGYMDGEALDMPGNNWESVVLC